MHYAYATIWCTLFPISTNEYTNVSCDIDKYITDIFDTFFYVDIEYGRVGLLWWVLKGGMAGVWGVVGCRRLRIYMYFQGRLLRDVNGPGGPSVAIQKHFLDLGRNIRMDPGGLNRNWDPLS